MPIPKRKSLPGTRLLTAAVAVSLSSFSLHASLRASVHWPRNGDRVTKQRYEYVEVTPDTSVWDFSHAIATGVSHEMSWRVLGDTVLVRVERGAQSTYTIHGDSLVWRSHESPLIGLRDSVAPLVLCGALPAAGDSIVSPYYFGGLYSGANAVAFKGTHTTRTVARGTLILPDDTIAGAVLVREIADGVMKASAQPRMAPIRAGAEGLLRHTVVTDRWYSPSCRYEVAENLASVYSHNGRVLQEQRATFLCSPGVQEVALGMFQAPPTQPAHAGRSRLVGSPLSERVSIAAGDGGVEVMVNAGCAGAAEGDVSVILSDTGGRVWASRSGSAAAGGWSTRISTSSLPPGGYILHVSAGEESASEKIQIK